MRLEPLISHTGILMTFYLERLDYKHIYNYLIDNNLITSHQSGFNPGDSALINPCTSQMNLVERWMKVRK
jgi:hypothetical protein